MTFPHEGRRRKLALAFVILFSILAAGYFSYGYEQEIAKTNNQSTQISDLQSQLSSLQGQNDALEHQLKNTSLLQSELSTLSTKVQNLSAIASLNQSILLISNSSALQNARNSTGPGFTLWNAFPNLHYAGYVIIRIDNSNATNCLLESSWSSSSGSGGVNFTQAWQFGSGANQTNGLSTLKGSSSSAILPVLPSSNLQIAIVNLGSSASVEQVSIVYYY